jgi:hypothetical protein
MIRRDYFLRMVQEMAQVLARAVLLKHRHEYDQALKDQTTRCEACARTAPHQEMNRRWSIGSNFVAGTKARRRG